MQRAAACFEQAIPCDARYTEALHYLGLTLLLQGQVQRAQRLAEAVRLDLDPGSPVIRNNLGLAFVQAGDSNGAEQCFRRAIQHRPDYVDARANLARIY
ncbi:MAG: tetratricopeptide repeat protein [Gammaproteobacteria bacterium]|nr:tetratricopeptide repeat protein [Gammaproteobacteria bacterium]